MELVCFGFLRKNQIKKQQFTMLSEIRLGGRGNSFNRDLMPLSNQMSEMLKNDSDKAIKLICEIKSSVLFEGIILVISAL